MDNPSDLNSFDQSWPPSQEHSNFPGYQPQAAGLAQQQQAPHHPGTGPISARGDTGQPGHEQFPEPYATLVRNHAQATAVTASQHGQGRYPEPFVAPPRNQAQVQAMIPPSPVHVQDPGPDAVVVGDNAQALAVTLALEGQIICASGNLPFPIAQPAPSYAWMPIKACMQHQYQQNRNPSTLSRPICRSDHPSPAFTGMVSRIFWAALGDDVAARQNQQRRLNQDRPPHPTIQFSRTGQFDAVFHTSTGLSERSIAASTQAPVQGYRYMWSHEMDVVIFLEGNRVVNKMERYAWTNVIEAFRAHNFGFGPSTDALRDRHEFLRANYCLVLLIGPAP